MAATLRYAIFALRIMTASETSGQVSNLGCGCKTGHSAAVYGPAGVYICVLESQALRSLAVCHPGHVGPTGDST